MPAPMQVLYGNPIGQGDLHAKRKRQCYIALRQPTTIFLGESMSAAKPWSKGNFSHPTVRHSEMLASNPAHLTDRPGSFRV